MPTATGLPLDRIDGRLKLSGQALYTADHIVPGVIHGVLITSAIAKGRIRTIDPRAALELPGVLAVLTHYDRLQLAKDASQTDPGNPADRVLQLLQNDQILYSNQPVGIALASTFEAALEAASLTKVTYAEAEPSVRFDQATARPYAPQKMGGSGDKSSSGRGNFQTAFADAPVRMENVYTTPFQAHSPMEPHATIAVWESSSKLTLYDTSQGIFGDRKRIASLLGLDPENVRVVCLFVGGGFGSKGPCWSHSVICAMAARKIGHPVKLVLRRPQTFGPVGCRTETKQTIAVAAKADGRLAALRNETLTHTSTFDEFTESASLPTRMLYSVPNNETAQLLIRSDIGTPSYTRAPGEAPGTFALECAMDELAVNLKMDPLDLRLRNYAERDEDKNQPWSTKALRVCYQRGAEQFGWSRRQPIPGSMRDGKMLIGWGMATAVYPARRSPASARARIYPDGSVLIEAGSQDLGGGTYTIMAQIAADALGVPISVVQSRLGDTRFPETPVSGGSQTAATTGSAVDAAARALRQKLFELVSVAGAKVEDLEIGKDQVKVKGAGRSHTLRELLGTSPFLEAEATTKANPDSKKFSSYSFGAQFAEVRIDPDLCAIHVSRMVGAFGAGKILNTKTARSQLIGGMVWGVSFALHEHATYDERLGRIVNNNFADYHVPTNADIGAIEVLCVDEDDRTVSPIGAKGIGEIGITGSAAAIANAVYHATGRRVRDLPITPDKLV